MAKKTPRFRRQPAGVGGLRIQKRDIEIIRLVHNYRFLDSKQIRALIDGSDQVILRRLQKLFHHGYLDRPVSQIIFSNPLLGHENMVYGLGDEGANLLADRSGIDRGKILWKEKNKEVGERYIQHTLMISNFRVCLTLALKSARRAKLLFWMRENSQKLRDKEYVYFKERGRQRRLPIVPDGFFGVQESADEMYFCLEADRSTMSNARFLNKMRGYWLWWRQGGQKKKFGIDNFRVLTITKTEQRKENLRRITKGADSKQTGSLMFWFTSHQQFSLSTPGSVLGKIWQTPKDDERHRLLE